ncbi:MAG: hypothetical protein KTR35_21015 [Gammaproteobacteria bacterium]|nr:hypothetical protein [Gammaproteobacteria bacterium]
MLKISLLVDDDRAILSIWLNRVLSLSPMIEAAGLQRFSQESGQAVATSLEAEQQSDI